MHWHLAAAIFLASADAAPAQGPPPAGWTKRVERGAVVLSLRSNEAVPDSLGGLTEYPALVVECRESPRVSIDTRLALLGPSFNVEPILVRFDGEAAREVSGQVASSTVLFGERSRELLQELLSHDRMAVRLLAREGRIEPSFDLRGLAVVLGTVEGRCGLPPAGAPAGQSAPPAPAVAPSARPVGTAPAVAGWSIDVQPNAFGRGDTVLLAAPSDQARAKPGSPHAALLIVRAHEKKVEVYVSAPAILEDLESSVVRFDDEEPRTLVTSPASNRRGLFFPDPLAFLRGLARHRRMTIALKVFGVAERRDVAFDLEGLDQVAAPLLAAAGLAPTFLSDLSAEPPRAAEREPGAASGVYRGFNVTAELMEKDQSVGGEFAGLGRFLASKPENHVIAVRLKLVRAPGEPSDWKIDKRKATMPSAEVRLVDGEGVTYPAVGQSGMGVASFDKKLEKGTVWFYFEVPQDVVCNASTVELQNLRLLFMQRKFPNTCG